MLLQAPGQLPAGHVQWLFWHALDGTMHIALHPCLKTMQPRPTVCATMKLNGRLGKEISSVHVAACTAWREGGSL